MKKKLDTICEKCYIKHMRNENKRYSVTEISELTGFCRSMIINRAEKYGVKKLGDGKTCSYLCGQDFLDFLMNLKKYPRSRPRMRSKKKK